MSTEERKPYLRALAADLVDAQAKVSSIYDEMAECYRRGSQTVKPNPTTEHVAIENAIDVIIDLRDEVAKLRRTVTAQYGEIGEGITDNVVCRFRNMLERAYPRRGRNESVESWRGKLWAFYCAVDKFLPITTAMADRAYGDHEQAEAEFDRTIRGGGILRAP